MEGGLYDQTTAIAVFDGPPVRVHATGFAVGDYPARGSDGTRAGTSAWGPRALTRTGNRPLAFRASRYGRGDGFDPLSVMLRLEFGDAWVRVSARGFALSYSTGEREQ